jgi:hypothetical protein
MDPCSGNGGVAHRDTQLMKVCHDVTSCVKAWNSGLLASIYYYGLFLGCFGSYGSRQ